jgi:predicted nucleotidyltransferase
LSAVKSKKMLTTNLVLSFMAGVENPYIRNMPLDPLTHYAAERDVLLKQITQRLQADPRVVAAWLFGSLGRGDEDALSDLDIFAVVGDDHIPSDSLRRRSFSAQFDTPLLFLEAPQNAPAGGAYQLVYYDAPTAPHQVDWYWQPYSLAAIPPETRLLFDRVGLDRSEMAVTFGGQNFEQEPVTQPTHDISFFWAMLMIVAKGVIRDPWAEAIELLPLILDPIHSIQNFLNLDNSLFSAEAIPAHQSPLTKLRILRQLADHMRTMMPMVTGQGIEIPNAILPGAYRYLNMAEAVISIGPLLPE